MLVRVDEYVIKKAEVDMIESGDVEPTLVEILAASAKIRECGCTPLYIFDVSDGTLSVFMEETYGRKLH